MSASILSHRQPEFNQRLYGGILRRPCRFHGHRRLRCITLNGSCFSARRSNLLFPLAILAGGIGAALVVFSWPSHLLKHAAIICHCHAGLLHDCEIRSGNIDAVGGPRGLLGMEKLTTLSWVFFWTALSVWVIRNLVYSNFGRGVCPSAKMKSPAT